MSWTHDSLNVRRLEFRLKVFEMVCAPSVLAQTNQDFDWIILVDKDHPPALRARLSECVKRRPRTYLHELSPTEDIGNSTWLTRYAPPDARYLITTNLDDDDALPVNFIESVQSLMRKRSGTLPPLMTLGYRSSLQWELISSRRAPLGYTTSWWAGDWVRSAGISLVCQMEHSLTVLAINHQIGDLWFEIDKKDGALRHVLETEWGNKWISPQLVDDIGKWIEEFRVRVHPLVEQAIDWSKRAGAGLFVDLTDSTGPIVMTDHFFITTIDRLLAEKSNRLPVTGRESFPNTVMEVELLKTEEHFFKKQWRMYKRVLGQIIDLHFQYAGRRFNIRPFIRWAWRFSLL